MNERHKPITENYLLNDLAQLIEQSKQHVALQVNSVLTILFWKIGNRINQDILENKRAEYGKQIVPTVSAQLENKYDKNFELRNVRRMMQFAEQFTATEVVVSLSQTLSWSQICLPKTNYKKKSNCFTMKQKKD